MNLSDYINKMNPPKFGTDYWEEYESDDYGLVDIHVLHDKEGISIVAYPVIKSTDTSTVLLSVTGN